jgi:hypothetical protein
MAKATEKAKIYEITVKNNPNFVGKGAGGLQFANGRATTTSPRLAEWFKTHNGYDVKEAAEG